MLGDSRVIIKSIAENTLLSQMQLRQLSRKIQASVTSFRKIEFFHILRKLNSKVDLAANIGSALGYGILMWNGVSAFFQLP